MILHNFGNFGRKFSKYVHFYVKITQIWSCSLNFHVKHSKIGLNLQILSSKLDFFFENFTNLAAMLRPIPYCLIIIIRVLGLHWSPQGPICLACYIDENRRMQVDEDIVDPLPNGGGRVHRCFYDDKGRVAYEEYPCGFRGNPPCSPLPKKT